MGDTMVGTPVRCRERVETLFPVSNRLAIGFAGEGLVDAGECVSFGMWPDRVRAEKPPDAVRSDNPPSVVRSEDPPDVFSGENLNALDRRLISAQSRPNSSLFAESVYSRFPELTDNEQSYSAIATVQIKIGDNVYFGPFGGAQMDVNSGGALDIRPVVGIGFSWSIPRKRR